MTDSLHTSIQCPKCHSCNYIKHGKYNDVQRYRCKNPSCRHTFSDNSFSSFKNTKKFSNLWHAYLELMKSGLSIRQCADKLKITIVTSFYWRHKILSWFNEINKTPFYYDYVEITKLFTKENFKGRRNISTKERRRIIILSSLDQQKNIMSKPICYTCLQMKNVKEFITPYASKNTYLNGFSDRVIAGFGKVINKHNRWSQKKLFTCEIDKYFSLKLNKWYRRFYGIGTKYLNHYLSWNIFNYKYPAIEWIDLILDNNTTYKRWIDLACTNIQI